MKHYRKVLLCCVFCVLALSRTGRAGFAPSPSLPELVQQADVICVGTTGQTHTLGQAMFDTGVHGPDGKPLQVQAGKGVADFAIEDVLKGNLAEPHIKVLFPKNLPATGAQPVIFAELVAGERLVLFLKSGPDKGSLTLVSPSAFPRPHIPIGKAGLKNKPLGLTPLRAVLLYLAAALVDEDKSVRRACLERIEQAGFILYKPSKGLSDIVARIREELKEPPLELEEFIQGNVLPAVMNLITVPDAEIRVRAAMTAAALQNAEIIPELIKLIKLKDQRFSRRIASAIGDFRVPEAVKLLIPLLKDGDSYVRERTAYALRTIANPLALPFLIKSLDDPDPQIRYLIVSALHTITDEGEWPSIGRFQEKEKEYISFWKRWAVEHKEKLETLRVQSAHDYRRT